MAPKGSEKGLAGEKRMRTPRAPESMVALTHLAVMLAYAAAAAVPTVTSRPLSLGPAWVPGADHVTGESTFLLYVKINKCASSTTAGVARRIASRHGLAGAARADTNNSLSEQGNRVWANHGYAEGVVRLVPSPLGTSKVFLFTVVREPLNRAVSDYFHFGVSRRHFDHADADVIGALNKTRPNFICVYARLTPESTPEQILKAYDFVGVAELFAETMTALSARLGVPLVDVLYVSAKNASAGGKDITTGPIVAAPPAQLARVRAAFGDVFEEKHASDYRLWRGATAFVRTATTDTARLAHFRRLEDYASGLCAADQKKLRDCLWIDNGCAQSCLDRRAAEYYERNAELDAAE